MVEKQKIKAIVTKHQRVKRRISLFSEEKENYESDTRNETILDQANEKYLLEL